MLAAPLLALLASTLVPDMPPPPERAYIPLGAKTYGPTIIEWKDFGGEASTARGVVDMDSARDWCGSWKPGTDAEVEECAKDIVKSENGRVYESKANCATGELWSANGQKYLFDGTIKGDEFWDGYVAIKDAKTGKRVPSDNASNGLGFALEWLTLCPYGTPYDRLPVETVLHDGPDQERYGMFAGHNGSTVFFDQRRNLIVYEEPKPSLAGTVKPHTVLFHGWMITGGYVRGVAYTYKKGCKPAPYFVEGYDQGGGSLTLKGKAPVRKGCDVVGYTEKSGNATLVFDLGE